MENKDFLRLVELMEQASAASAASEATRASENGAFQQTISDLNATIKQLHDTIGSLLEENRLLKGPKKNSGNSSIPPSKDENRSCRTSSLRKSSGKSSGGQTGHEGTTLKMTTTPDCIIDHIPGFCTCCGLDLQTRQTELASSRQVVDIPVVKPLYTEHRVFKTTCSCGQQTTGTFPAWVDAPISYGQQTTALIAYLHTRQYIPLARISEFFTSVYRMRISQGTVCGILDRFAQKAVPALQLIKDAVLKANVIGSDETGMKENGKQSWFWTWQSKFATYICSSPNRGLATIEANFPTGFPKAILTHDCWASHFNTPAAGHQICTAPLLRELTFFQQKYKSSWAQQFSKIITQALELQKKMLPFEYKNPLKARAELEDTLDQLLQQKIQQKHREVLTFQKRLIKYRKYLFTFLYHQDVSSDNNASERAIRSIKGKQKVSGMFKSAKGAHNYAIMRSITDTCNKNQQGILNAFLTVASLQSE